MESSCLFSQLVPLQLVAKIPGKEIPLVLWDNEVIDNNSCLANQDIKTGLQKAGILTVIKTPLKFNYVKIR